jgi:hypothetical protein
VCLSLVLLLLSTPALAQTIRVVDDDGQASPASCEDSAAALTTPAAGIAAAVNGDTVLVCPGTYVGGINFGGKAITVRSVSGPAVTILDGNGAGPVVTFATGETAASVLEGFTVRNGFGSHSGGGIVIQSASPAIKRNLIVHNRACQSLGIYSNFGSPVIEENTIAYNTQAGCSGGTIGGGIAIVGSSSAVIRRNNIHHNGGVMSGGGIALWAAGTPVVEQNVIWENSAELGGGIELSNHADANIVGNVVFRNRAGRGGGIYWLVPSGARGPLLVNNTIADNDSLLGSGILADGYDAAAALYNNIVVARTGQIAVLCGDFNDQNPPIFRSNTIFSATGVNYGGICVDQTGSNGNISVDPLFVDAPAGDFHLAAGSAAIDAGSDEAPAVPALDIDSHARVLDGDAVGGATVDMGADEAAPAGILPGAFGKTAPADGAQLVTPSPALVWDSSAGATSYEFCVDTVDNGACDGTWQPAWASTAVSVPNLSGGTTYYWQVRAHNGGGVTYANGSAPAFFTFATLARGIALAGNMAFGDVYVGERPTRTLTISNTGTAPLTVSGISYPQGFSGAWSGTIAAGASQDVTVTFSPASTRTYDGDIVIVGDQTSGVTSVRASGRGVVLALSSFTANVSFSNPTAYAGNTVTFTALASGVNLEYQFWRYSVATGQWTSMQGYGTSNQAQWTPTAADVGTYHFQVWVRRSGFSAAYELWKGLGPIAVVVPRATVIAFSCSPTASVPIGVQVSCFAGATGPLTTHYRFYRYVGQTQSWVMLRDYGTGNSVTFTPTAAGTDYVQVWVRSASSTAPYDDWRASAAIQVVPMRLAAPVANVALPARVNVPMTWTVGVTGALPSAQYQFWLYSAAAGSWSLLRDYGPATSATWTPSAPGAYAIQVWGRNGASGPFDAWSGTGLFTVVEPALTLLSLAPNVPLPSAVSAPIVWTAVADGAQASTRYQFWLFELGVGWTMLQAYSPSATVEWTPQRAGTYWLQVWARKEGAPVSYETWIGTGAVEIR